MSRKPSFKVEIESERLSQLFSKTWNSLPAADRRKIARRIAIVIDANGFATKRRPPLKRGTILNAEVQPLATGLCSIYLNRKALEDYTDRTIQSAIAHELGHVFCNHAHLPPRDSNEKIDVDRAEDEADERAVIWGYEPVNYILNEKPLMEALIALYGRK